MATVHEIATVAHKLTTSDGELWAILLPSLIASIVPTAAVVFTFLQSRESTRLAREQAKATNEVARRQVALAEQKQVHESRTDLYETWKLFNDEVWDCYLLMQGEERHAAGYMNKWLASIERVANTSLRMRFFFGDDVVTAVDKLVHSVWQFNNARYAYDGPDPLNQRDIKAVTDAYSVASDDLRTKIDEVRDAVRLYTVHGLKREG